MEEKRGIDYMLRIGNQVKKVRLHVIVAFFIGDGKVEMSSLEGMVATIELGE